MLLGPGLHWGRSQEELLNAIDRAQKDNMLDAAEHLRIILKLRNQVMMDDEKKPRSRAGQNTAEDREGGDH